MAWRLGFASTGGPGNQAVAVHGAEGHLDLKPVVSLCIEHGSTEHDGGPEKV